MQVQQVGGVRGTFPQGGRFSGSMNFFGGKRFSGAGTEAKAKNPTHQFQEYYRAACVWGVCRTKGIEESHVRYLV